MQELFVDYSRTTIQDNLSRTESESNQCKFCKKPMPGNVSAKSRYHSDCYFKFHEMREELLEKYKNGEKSNR